MTLLMATPLGVAIAGQPYPHLLFQLILSHSGWRYAEVATSETFPALQQGPQSDLWALGRVPEVVPSDNTSAATHEMRRRRGRALNDNYASLLEHYGLRSHPHQSRPEPQKRRRRAGALPPHRIPGIGTPPCTPSPLLNLKCGDGRPSGAQSGLTTLVNFLLLSLKFLIIPTMTWATPARASVTVADGPDAKHGRNPNGSCHDQPNDTGVEDGPVSEQEPS